MTQIVVSDAILATLGPLTGPVVLCNSSGRRIAFVTPVADPTVYEGVDIDMTSEELAESLKEPARPLTQILADWEAGRFPTRDVL